MLTTGGAGLSGWWMWRERGVARGEDWNVSSGGKGFQLAGERAVFLFPCRGGVFWDAGGRTWTAAGDALG